MKLGFFRLKDIDKLTYTLRKLSDLLYQYENDLLGVEYLAFFHDSEKDNFGCLLCTKFKKGNLQSMLNHFKTKLHWTSFLQKHFPNVYERLEKMEIDVKPSEEEFRTLLKSLIKEIISRCPKGCPIALSINNAISCKIEIAREIFETSEIKEKAINTLCIDLIVQIKKFGNSIRQNQSLADEKTPVIKSIAENNDLSDGEIFDDMELQIETGKLKINEAKRKRIIRSNSRQRSRVPSINRLISEYKYKYENASKIIESKYKGYKITPDSHPNYNLEWKYYWTKKVMFNPYADDNSTNFIEAWKIFFEIRLAELELEDKLKARIRIRNALRLPIDPVDNQRLERILSSQSDDERMVANFNYDEEIRRYSPKRKRAAVNINEIEEKDLTKMKTRERLSIIKNKSNKPNFVPHKNSQNPEMTRNLKATTAKINQNSIDANNNEMTATNNLQEDHTIQAANNNDISDRNNQQDDNSEQATTEKDNIFIMRDKELILLYRHYDGLTDETKSHLTAYMEELKRSDPAKFERISKHELPESIGPEIPMSDDDEDYDEELLRNVSINAQTLSDSSDQELVNVSDAETEYIDMTYSD
ncbi:hypothetical protein ACKWTF_009617 [Chironomus riparius]